MSLEAKMCGIGKKKDPHGWQFTIRFEWVWANGSAFHLLHNSLQQLLRIRSGV